MDSVREELQKYNNQKQLEGTYNSHESRKIGCVQSNTSKENSRDRSTNTTEQPSRETGVSTANIAKYDVVMKSDNGDLKQSDIKIIMDYQKLLPILQQEDGSWIDARTLHKELGVGKKFTDWIKARISKYDFVENDDWKLTNHKIGKRSNVKVDDYSLTLDMAKELSMVENNKW